MRNDKFWDICEPNSIRIKVAEFIDTTPSISHLEGQKYYDLEDAIVSFIENNRHLIANEVDKEYNREDIINHASELYGDNGEMMATSLPIEYLDSLILKWKSRLENHDRYWEEFWDCCTVTMEDDSLFFGALDKYDAGEFFTYLAYVDEWLDNAMNGETDEPLPIDVFYDGETVPEDMIEYYRAVAVDDTEESNE